MKKKFENFRFATYVYAYYLDGIKEEDLRRDIEEYLNYAPLDKAYLEIHRGNVTIPVEDLKKHKEIFESYGITCSGGIVPTEKVGEKKPSIFDTYCYTDPEHRKAYYKHIADMAGIFDEIILDDFFFTACRCEKCLRAKGDRTWEEYRRTLMADISRDIVKLAKDINPNLNFIIKYPAWYKSYHETGYDPEVQRDIFDEVYIGTETRLPDYDMQHFQRYHSFSIMRWIENAAPGKNGGGWIDSGGSGHSINVFLEQVEQTAFAKPREITLWNFAHFVSPSNLNLPPLAKDLYRIDKFAGKLGNPVGTVVYEPFNSDGEDYIYTYYGMRGMAFEPKQYFDMDAPAVLLTASSAKDEKVIDKARQYLLKGGTVILTNGFIHDTWDRGVRDLTSLEITGKSMKAVEYMTGERNHAHESGVYRGASPIEMEVLAAKDNAGWVDISIIDRQFNAPLFNEEDYGKGQVFVLNVPYNNADVYSFPDEIVRIMAKYMSVGQRVYVSSENRVSLYQYDNDVFGVQNFEHYPARMRVFVRGDVKAIRDIETGEVYEVLKEMPSPTTHHDCADHLPEEKESLIEFILQTGAYRFFEIVKN